MDRYFLRRSIKWNVAVSFSLLIVLSINLIGYLSYNKYLSMAEDDARNHSYNIIDQVSRNAEYYLHYMEDLSTLIYLNKTIQNYLNESENAEADPVTGVANPSLQEAQITDYFNSFLNVRQDISSFYIFTNHGKVLTSLTNMRLKDYTDIKEQEWYRKAIEAGGAPVVTPTHVQNFLVDDYRWVVSLSREVKYLDTKKGLGVFLINLNFKVIQDICSQVHLGNKGYVFIVDKEGNLIYHPQQQLIYSKIKHEDMDLILHAKEKFVSAKVDGMDKLYTIKSSDYVNWTFVGVTYRQDLISDKAQIRTYFIVLSLVSVLAAVLISMWIASRISGPIKKLEMTMKQVEKGDLSVRVDVEGHGEVAQLGRTFHLMLLRINDLMTQLVSEQETKRKSELKALQAQINPHFLYNTLDSIIWMIQKGKIKEVTEMVSSLAKLFRLGISKGEDYITIREELAHVEHYLTIQKIRYKNKLDYSFEVDLDILERKIPRLILQPVVENAIYHGIKPSPNGGSIRIRAYRAPSPPQTDIILEVADNGVGMDEATLNQMPYVKQTQLHGGGVGVQNVQERIRLYCGERYGLQYYSRLGVGTIAKVLLQAKNEPGGA
ncbi:hypothetical protein SD70_13490 [Gordoniibacillus kamchatkensis]|uniref:HAMP domain-containing protein n=1 Tax=Gordoniibacillus kamchatkensis TaxID=1590651 RepID=A0ABR5AHF9_9BACL|nr:hypothetical protein SD70_13490 [Paenibacillus sp. VKM B-2647]